MSAMYGLSSPKWNIGSESRYNDPDPVLSTKTDNAVKEMRRRSMQTTDFFLT
jgi:hypothetical protein